MRRPPTKWTFFYNMVMAILVLTFTFVLAYYLANFIYNLAHFYPPALLSQLITSLLGLTIFGLVMSFFSKFMKDIQMTRFLDIIAALERIAQGDFSIRLENGNQQNNMFKELTTSVNKMASQLDQMENMRQEFISNVSHEIQSPLTSIRGFAQALKSNAISPQDRLHYLDIIETESMRLSRLSDDLLRLSSLDDDQVKIEAKVYRVDKQIRSLILTCEPQWTEKQINMEVSIKEASISGDQNLLSQVWLNLIHNSIKFTPQGGTIKITLHPTPEQVEFSVADNGIGISPEDQIHIFERFYKADKSRIRTNGGSGLGLSIAKKIIEIHKGTIRVESQPGMGATFIVSLPV